jgi:predicted ATPase
MSKFDGFRVKNFKSLKDISLGRLWNKQKVEPLSPLTAVIGKNGVGKSSLLDALGFVADCLRMGVEDACFAKGRGGFEKLRSLGQPGAIEFEIYYREKADDRPITYELAIDLDSSGRPFVLQERLRQRRPAERTGKPFSFVNLKKGRGEVWKGNSLGDEPSKKEKVELENPRILGVTTLGALKQHPRISAFRRFVEGWYLNYFTPNAARSLPMAGPQKHLNILGDNLGNVVQFMEREHKDRFDKILKRIAQKIPGIDIIKTENTLDDRLLLCFQDKGFNKPFYAQQMSDGTLKLFAYLLLLEDPNPPPFLCIEEPENGLYHKLLDILVSEFKDYTESNKDGSQIFITTHQPYRVDALTPKEVWILEKGEDGFSNIRRASDSALVCNLVAQELPLGSLWASDYLEKEN